MVTMQTHSKFIRKTVVNRAQVMTVTILGLITKKCEGRGICAVGIDPPLDQFDACHEVRTKISLNEDGALSFHFIKASCKDCTINKYFSQDTFTIEEAFSMPADITHLLGLDNFLIDAGEYELFEAKQSYCVIFPAAS
ncbi:MAG: hypothetical protein Sapg2KO_15500 [Saprospiraceae bacterium]